MRTFSLATLAGLALVPWCAVAQVASGSASDSASGDGSSTSGSSSSPDERRAVSYSFEPEKLEITSKAKTETDKSQFKFEVTSKEGFRARLRFSNQTETTKVDFKFRVRAEKVVEFDPSKFADGLYDGSKAGAAGVVKVTDLTKTPVNMVRNADPATGIRSYTYEQGNFKFVVYATGADVSLPGAPTVKLDPTSVKFDFDVAKYTYAAPENRLAIIMKIDASSKVKVKDDSTGTESTKTKGTLAIGSQGFFAFAETATCTGGTAVTVVAGPVAKDTDDDTDASKEAGEESNRVVFVFKSDAQTDICWDPQLGASADTTGSGSGDTSAAASTYAAAGALAFAAAVVLV
jgi:hypothetical protein